MRRVALRGLLARKTRLLLTALSVALGVTLIAGTYVFTDTINASFDKIFAASFADRLLVLESRLPVGSSAKTTVGFDTSARAIATRCC